MTHIKKLCCVVYVAVVLLALMPRASAEDPLKVAVARHGGWESAPVELGQQAGMFKKHGIALDLVYLEGSREVEQRVISGSAEVGLAVGAMEVMRAYAIGAPLAPQYGSSVRLGPAILTIGMF